MLRGNQSVGSVGDIEDGDSSLWPRRLYILALVLAGSVVAVAIGFVVATVWFSQVPDLSTWQMLQFATGWVLGFPCMLILAAVGLLVAPLMAWDDLNGWRSLFVVTLKSFSLVALLVVAASIAYLVSALWGPRHPAPSCSPR